MGSNFFYYYYFLFFSFFFFPISHFIFIFISFFFFRFEDPTVWPKEWEEDISFDIRAIVKRSREEGRGGGLGGKKKEKSLGRWLVEMWEF